MNREVTAAILAGGESTRFGTDKALFVWRGKPLVAHAVEGLRPEVAEVLVVAKSAAPFEGISGLGARIVLDGRTDSNPFWGLLAALGAVRTPWLFLCPCDAPLVRPGLLRALFDAREGALAVVPVWGGAEQPLAALYHRDALETAMKIAERDSNASPRALARALGARLLSEEEVRHGDPEGLSFRDADRTQDLEALEPFAGGPGAD